MQKVDSNSKAGTAADSNMQPIVTTSASIEANPLLVAAFPGTGKSYYCSNGDWSQYVPEMWCTDSDSSKFDKADFPENYIRHIKEQIAKGYARIMISSHKEVRDALVKEGLHFVLIYPKKELKEEYLERYKQRGNNERFIDLISQNWDNWIDELKTQKGCRHIELRSGQFVSNVV